MRNSLALRILLYLTVYFCLRFFGGEIGYKILYPINLLVTFLHEFGHAVGAILTGGSVLSIEISPNGAGATRTLGGSFPIILMGGYIGSAIFGNLLFLIGARSQNFAKPVLGVLAASMIFSSVFWFRTMFTSGFLIVFALVLLFIVFKTNWAREILMFLGLACIVYIVQDFNVGPTSDLTRYAEEMVILPMKAWMYIWLGIVLFLCYWNLKLIFRLEDKVVQDEF